MYSFEPSEEQQMLVDAINRYAMNDLRVQAHDADEEAQLPPDLVEKGWELGFLQASIPEEYGGFGERSLVTGVLAVEELAYGVIIAPIFHLIWCSGAHFIFGYKIAFESILFFLTTQSKSISNIKIYNVFQSVISHPVEIFWYFFSINTFAIWSGCIINKFIRKHFFDIKYSCLRFDDPWYYLFTGKALLIESDVLNSKDITSFFESYGGVYISDV